VSFPVSFADANVAVTATVRDAGAIGAFAMVSTITASSFSLQYAGASGSTGMRSISWVAIGRWK
jgi:hypothetical protein